MCFDALAMSRHQRRQRLFTGHGGLQERTRRQGHLCRAHHDGRRRPHQHQLAMARQPRQPMLFGEARQCGDQRRRQRAGAAHVDVEADIGGRDLDVERLADHDQRLGQRPGRIERAAQAGIEDRAAVDRNDVVRTCRTEADLEHLVGAHPGVQRDAAAADAMGIDQRVDVAIDLRPRQRLDHDVAFPGCGRVRFPNAGSRIRRRRRNADRTARSAAGLACRPAAGAGGPGDPAPSPPRWPRPIAYMAHRPAVRRQRRRRRRDDRRDRW